jgi:hypothetical protein
MSQEYSQRETFAPDFLENAVLVYGPRKSGTTLLQSLLDGGAQMLMLPGEAKIKFLFEPRVGAPYLLRYALQENGDDWTFARATIGAGALERIPGGVHLPGLSLEETARVFDLEKYRDKLKELHAAQPDHTYEKLARGDTAPHREYSRMQNDVRAEVAAFAACVHGREYSHSETAPRFKCWAIKEVGGHPQKIIERWRALVPNLKIIFLVRDPRFVVRSIILDRRRKGIRLGFFKIWKECEAAQDIVGAAFSQKLDCDVIVSYEQLTRDTPTEMQRIAKVIGIEWTHRLSAPTMLGQSAVVRTSSQKTDRVFQSEKSWDDDLFPYQKRAIRWFYCLAPIFYKWRGRAFVRYHERQNQ